MIEFYVSPETPAVLLEGYNELFDFIADFEDSNGSGDRSWSFTVHSPHRVFSLYNNREKGSFASDVDPNLQEAYDEQLSLLEICAGDYTKPQYVALTPNVDTYGLKKKWCQDYCAFHEIEIRETFEGETDASKISEKKIAVPLIIAAPIDVAKLESTGGPL